jgi:hypothetical protein
MTVISESYVESRKAQIVTEATWYAIGYTAATHEYIGNADAVRFANSYAELYAEWTDSGDIERYPGLGVALRDWLAKQ